MGVLEVYSPPELLVHWRLDYKKHCCVLPRSYCKVHDQPVLLNTMMTCTHECIVCGLAGNLQGNVKFYCLTSP